MFKNYFKVAFRNLWKNKGFTSINIIGLSVGLATCLLILLYVMDELSFDKYNEKAGRIFRVDSDITFGGNHFVAAVTPEPMGATIKRDYPEVETEVRFRNYGGMLVRKGSQNLQEEKVIYADSTLFDVFTLPMLYGDPKTALVNPNSVVINETTAKKYFNTADVVGKSLLVNDDKGLKITGVIKDVPNQSHFNFDFFIATNGAIEKWEINQWTSNNLNTYIVLKESADPKVFEAKLDGMVAHYVAPELKQLNMTMESFKQAGNHLHYGLMPVTDIHLHSNKTSELGPNSSIEYVYIFSVVAVFILLIACVNFMNLSTARSSGRAKEVGVRKVLGSIRSNLVSQFLTESILITFISLLLALGIAALLLSYFNQLAGKHISITMFGNPWLLSGLVVLMLVVGLLAGSYPAFYLSSFRPIEVLKGKLAAGFKSGWLRSWLVVFQFWISIVLIIGTIVIYNQLSYIRNKDIGFKRDNVLIIRNTYPLGAQADAFKNEILKITGVTSATKTGFLPTSGWRSDSPLFQDATLDQKTAISLQQWRVDENYVPTLGMQMAKGRNFSKQMLTDSMGVILNEAAANMLTFKDPVGKKLYHIKDFNLEKKEIVSYQILGVVKNFNFNSLRDQVTPLALFLDNENGSITFRLNTSNTAGIVAAVENKWKAMVPTQPFQYSFMDDDFNNTYKTEQQIGQIFISFAVLAILIACLGLFGLVTYAAEQRTKEIGIRKVLGASAGTIVGMLSKDFVKLVAISAVVAFPIAWWAMHTWLQGFAYRTPISWWIFVMAGVAALAIALITVSMQAIKAALANPVKSLRAE